MCLLVDAKGRNATLRIFHSALVLNNSKMNEASLGRMASLKDPYPLPPEELKRLSEVKFDHLENEVTIIKDGYNIRPWPWIIGVFGIAFFSKLIGWSVSGFTNIN